MPPDETESERLVREYLDANGYTYDRPDRDDRTQRRADFRIHRDGRAVAIAEVKEWRTHESPYPSSGFGVLDPHAVLKPIRTAVNAAAPQLRTHREEGLPLLAVLANPRRFPISTDPHELAMALSGNPVFTFSVDTETGAAAGSVRLEYGRYGRVRPPTERDPGGERAYISGVVMLHERHFETDWSEQRGRIGFGPAPQSIEEAVAGTQEYQRRWDRDIAEARIPVGTYISLDVVETLTTMTGHAVPLPDDMLNAPGDRRFAYRADGSLYLKRGRNVARLLARARLAEPQPGGSSRRQRG